VAVLAEVLVAGGALVGAGLLLDDQVGRLADLATSAPTIEHLSLANDAHLLATVYADLEPSNLV